MDIHTFYPYLISTLVAMSLGGYALAIITGLTSRKSTHKFTGRPSVVCTAFAVTSLTLLAGINFIVAQSLLPWELLLCIILSGFNLFSVFKLHLRAPLNLLNICCFSLISAHLIIRPTTAQTLTINLCRDVHIVLATLGQGAAIIAVICATLILVKQKSLKTKNSLEILTSPPLETLKRVFDLSSISGLLCFSLALISGLLFVSAETTPQASFIRIKLIWALSIWLYYLYLFHLKTSASIPLSKRSKQTLWGLSGLLATYVLITSMF